MSGVGLSENECLSSVRELDSFVLLLLTFAGIDNCANHEIDKIKEPNGGKQSYSYSKAACLYSPLAVPVFALWESPCAVRRTRKEGARRAHVRHIGRIIFETQLVRLAINYLSLIYVLNATWQCWQCWQCYDRLFILPKRTAQNPSDMRSTLRRPVRYCSVARKA